MQTQVEENEGHRSKSLAVLVLGALGIVYGDIGTSPLYALRVCFGKNHPFEPSPENVLGILSLIFWALMLVISLKYMAFVLRADNRGEGGIMALMALAAGRRANGKRGLLVALGLFGASLLYGDGMITPAISVLSAIEGIGVLAPQLEPYVVPLTALTLVFLFLFQKRGTAKIGAVFGPIILVWFFSIGLLGVCAIVQEPRVLAAINPMHAALFMAHHGVSGFLVLGAVFLVVTGGEALYADMGHFGRSPIRWGWFAVALPGLLMNYFGQGALLLLDARTIDNPFYGLVPRWGLLPMVGLSTAATVIASQAVISGAFSMTRQAVLLGYLPRVNIIHTSAHTIGQIYIPVVNRFLFVATIGLVIGFRSSDNLAAAYGVSVTTTMLITTLLLFVVARRRWGWGRLSACALTGLFLVFDVSFSSATLTKVLSGGWFPLVMGVLVFLVMETWRLGRAALNEQFAARSLSLDLFIQSITLAEPTPARVPGTAIFMSGNQHGTPPVLLHNIKYNKVLHEVIAVVTVLIEEAAYVPEAERIEMENLGQGFYRIRLRYGFMESPDVPQALVACREQGLPFDERLSGYFLGHENVRIANKSGMPSWRQRLFAFLTRNAYGATGFFNIPPNQVVELGVQVEL